MSTDRPDLPSFDGRDVREHADAAAAAVRAINHITSWPHAGMSYPSDAYVVLSRLSSIAAMLPQACRQIEGQLIDWHAARHIGIDAGQQYAGRPDQAVAVVIAELAGARECAAEMYDALAKATQAVANAHWTGPDPAENADPDPGMFADGGDRA